MPRPRAQTANRLAGFEPLEAREVPAAIPLADLNTTPAPSFDGFNPHLAGVPTGALLNGSAVFVATDGVNPVALWKSDGTAAGTKLVAPMAYGPSGPWDRPSQLTAAGNAVFFAYNDGTHGNTVWATDGTTAGTRLVVDPAAYGSVGWPSLVGAVGGRALFTLPVSAGTGYDFRLYSTDGTAAAPTLLRGLGQMPPSFTLACGTAYFTAPSEADANRSSLWKTDGTVAGTARLADLPAGVTLAAGYGPQAGAIVAAVGPTVYFAAQDYEHGYELWATDGAGGARLVKDINTSRAESPAQPAPPGNGDAAPQQLVAFGGKLYFVADDGAHGQELWSTDGTAAGTRMVADLSAGVGSEGGAPWNGSGSRITGLRVANGRLLFTADDGTAGPQLYSSDGTDDGTAALTAFVYADPLFTFPGSYPYTPPALVGGAAGGKTYFWAEGTVGGTTFGVTDGTAAGTITSTPAGLTGPVAVGVLGGKLLFQSEGPDGRQLRLTDGTAAGTRTVARINPNSLGSYPGAFTAVNDRTAVFVGWGGGVGASALYATDGAGAPVRLKAFDQTPPGLSPGYSWLKDTPDQLTRAGGKVYFLATFGNFGRQLWVTDGTAAGTKVVKEVEFPPDQAGPWGTYRSGLDNLTAGPGGVVYFTLDLSGAGQQLWKSDGTADGTVVVKQVNTTSTRDPALDPNGGPAGGPVHQLTAVGNRLYFAAWDAAAGDELWTSDGTAAGTKRLKDLNPGTAGASPANFAAAGGKLVFTADDGAGRKLWASDGTADGTRPLTPVDFPSWAGTGSTSRALVSAGGKVFYAARDAAGLQLWATDGTAAGTRRVSNVTGPPEFPGGPTNPQVAAIVPAGGKVYFTALDGAAGGQLFVSDGTAAGTRMVKKIGTGAAGVAPPVAGLAVGDKLLFAADDGDHGRELWVTDGTAAGTRMVQDIGAGKAGGVGIAPVADSAGVAVNGRVVFGADTGTTGVEPWSVPFADLGITATPPTPTPPPATPGAKPTVVSVAKLTATAGASGLFTLGTVDLPAGPAYKVWVFWGDKEVSAGALTRATQNGSTFTVTGTHAYAAAGAYKPQFRVTADGKTVLTVDTTAAVADARFYAGRVAERVTAGRAFALPVATIRTLSPTGGQAADYTATIDWGDGTTGAGTVRKAAAGHLEVVGEHTFTAPARRTVAVTITAKGGTTATAESLFVIDAARPPRV